MFFASVVKLQENFSPSGPAISSTDLDRATGEKDKVAVSYDKPCKNQEPLISSRNESSTAPSKFVRKKETGEQSKGRPKVHTHFVGFGYPSAHWHRGPLLRRVSSPRSTTVLVIVIIIITFPVPAPGVSESGAG